VTKLNVNRPSLEVIHLLNLNTVVDFTLFKYGKAQDMQRHVASCLYPPWIERVAQFGIYRITAATTN